MRCFGVGFLLARVGLRRFFIARRIIVSDFLALLAAKKRLGGQHARKRAAAVYRNIGGRRQHFRRNFRGFYRRKIGGAASDGLGFGFAVEAFGNCGARGIIAGRVLRRCLVELQPIVVNCALRFVMRIVVEMVGRAAEFRVARAAVAKLARLRFADLRLGLWFVVWFVMRCGG